MKAAQHTCSVVKVCVCACFDSAPKTGTRFAAVEDIKASEGRRLIKDVCGCAGVRCFQRTKKDLSSSEEAPRVWLATQ